ncbi:MAG: hypothetical protein B6245_02730 [Desulfobacteraceae bacterium 4572_88]|nr:MAG: hypothetical protein B6245_02730 [Desulfobacteraceae bacterium 4572_88]RLC08798.1 MAG: hypothetical protein DRI57_23335 [Deltaproteobacteria bacterium]
MDECKQILNTGIRDVVIASTKISDVNGTEGKLIYRGYLVRDLAENASFEEIAHLLLREKLPSSSELDAFKAALQKERHIPDELTEALRKQPHDALPMDVLQAGVSMLALHDPDAKDASREASERISTETVEEVRQRGHSVFLFSAFSAPSAVKNCGEV